MYKKIKTREKEKLISQPKRFIFEGQRATIVLKEKPIEPEENLYFKNEYEKEKKDFFKVDL